MYAGTGEGQSDVIGMPGAGIFKSINGGLSWSQLNLPQNYYYVHKLAIHPVSGRIFAVITLGNQEDASNGAVQGRPNSGTLIYSDDKGVSWQWVNTLPFLSPGLTDIDINSIDPDLITLSGFGGFWKSTDGGDNFSFAIGGMNQLPSIAKRIEIAMANNTSRMYALISTDSLSFSPHRCALYKSIDAGVTWSQEFIDTSRVFPQNGFGTFSNTIWVNPLNENHVYFGGVNLWFSSDGGATASAISDWHQYHNGSNQTSLHADQHIILPAPDYSPLNKTVFFGNDGGIQMTSNISTVNLNFGWVNLCNTSLGITQFYSGGVAVDGSPFGGGAQDNSFSSGTSTSNWMQPNTGDGAYFAVSHVDDDIMYANTNYNHLWKSDDGGITWADATFEPVQGSPLKDPVDLESDKASLIAPFILDPDNANRIFMGAEQLWRFNDNLQTLVPIKSVITPVNQNPVTVTSIDVKNTGQRIWVGYLNGTIEFSENSGTTWSGNLNNSAMPDNFVTDIAIKPGNLNFNKEAIVTLAGYIDNNIWLHTEKFGNSTWTNISLPIAIQVNCVTYNPANHNWIYAGTDLGVFASEDKGQTWSITPIHGTSGNEYGNEGPVYTEVTDLFWSGDGGVNGPYRLWATTFGRGLWRSNFVLDKIYVDKSASNDFGPGTLSYPYKTLKTAASVAGHGATIVFLSSGNHNEAPSSVILDKRILIELNNGPVVVN